MCCQRIKRSTYLSTGVWILFQCSPSSPWFFCRCSLLMWHIVWTHGRNIKTYTGFRTLSAGDVNEDYVNSLDMVSLLRQPSTWSMVQMISYFLLWLTTQAEQWKSSAAKSNSLSLTPSQHLLFFTLEIWVAAATRAVPPILISVCSITVCPNSGIYI